MMQQRESRDGNVRKIEWAIRNEKLIFEAVEEARCAPRGHTGGSPTGHSYVSDPTAAQAIRQAEEVYRVDVGGRPLEWPERWLTVVNAVRQWCGRDAIRAEIFKRRYSGESYKSTCHAIHIADQTYHFALKEIRGFALQAAAQAQVIQVF
jgi:hypothetical protein